MKPATLPLRPSRPGNGPQVPRCGKSDYLLTLYWFYGSKMRVILDHLFCAACSCTGRAMTAELNLMAQSAEFIGIVAPRSLM